MRKNILIISHSYGLPFIESCNQYTQLFEKEKYEVTVVYLAGVPDDQIRQKTESEQVIFFNCSKAAIRGLKLSAIYKVLQLCRKKNFDIVISHRYKPTYIMLWVAQFCRIRALIFVMHAMETARAIPRKLLFAALARKNMMFAGVSDATRDDLRRNMWLFPQERIITLHNILDYKLFEPQLLSRQQARAMLNIPDDAFVFGHLGRFVKEKDQRTLLQAYAIFTAQHPHALLLMIGYGKLEAELRQQTMELGLQDKVIFTGFLADGFRLMKGFDAFVLCSIEEAFGRVLLEAMVARTPIIATRADGIPEVVGDAGFLSKPAQPEELARSMTLAFQMSPAERTQLGEKSYQRMKNTFSIESFKKTFWQLTILKQQES